MKFDEGWQAGLIKADGHVPADKAEARALCASLGWKLEWMEDLENGIWCVAIPEEDLKTLLSDGVIEKTCPLGEGGIEADLDMLDVKECPRCGAKFREDPSCGKVIHEVLPSRS